MLPVINDKRAVCGILRALKLQSLMTISAS
jgi:hypothetical protein